MSRILLNYTIGKICCLTQKCYYFSCWINAYEEGERGYLQIEELTKVNNCSFFDQYKAFIANVYIKNWIVLAKWMMD